MEPTVTKNTAYTRLKNMSDASPPRNHVVAYATKKSEPARQPRTFAEEGFLAAMTIQKSGTKLISARVFPVSESSPTGATEAFNQEKSGVSKVLAGSFPVCARIIPRPSVANMSANIATETIRSAVTGKSGTGNER